MPTNGCARVIPARSRRCGRRSVPDASSRCHRLRAGGRVATSRRCVRAAGGSCSGSDDADCQATDALCSAVGTGRSARRRNIVRPHPALAVTLSALVLLPACSTLHEIPREELADQPETRDVVVQMKNGERRAFDTARFGPDSLWGFNLSEESGDVPELSTTPMSLND